MGFWFHICLTVHLVLTHPNSIHKSKKNYNDERPNQRIVIPPIIIDMDTDFKIIFIPNITTLG